MHKILSYDVDSTKYRLYFVGPILTQLDDLTGNVSLCFANIY